MTNFTAATSVTGVSVTLADMGAAATIVGSDFADTIILTGSTGDDLSLDSGDGDDQITLASGTDRVLVTTGTGDATITFAGGDDHTITLGTGANVLNFDGAGAPGETTGVSISGFGLDDDIRLDADADTVKLVISTVSAALDSDTVLGGDTIVVTQDASVLSAVVNTVAGIVDFTDVADNGDVEVLLEALLGADGAAISTGMVILNDGTDSYIYAVTMSAAEEITALSLVGTIDNYIVNGTTDVIL
jgi:hypothetical protein